MLEEIRIRGLGVIDDALLELAPGLTVLTGETGAGKTMVVTGLGLLLGGRADAGWVRAGAEQAVVEGRVVVDPASPVARRARDAGAKLDDDVLTVARSVSVEGRSRAYLGGRSVPVAVLASLADDLVAVHGQSDQRRLLQPARQRAALDRFAGAPLARALDAYAAGYGRLQQVDEELARITSQAAERVQQADLLRFGLDEIAAVDPQPGEDGALAAEERRLAHADALRACATAAHAVLAGGDDEAQAAADALTLLAAARRALEPARAHDPQLAGLAERVAEAGYLLADVAADLASYAASAETDPARLAAVADRRAALARLTRKYGPDADAVRAWAEQAAARLATLDGDADRVAQLGAQRDALRAELGALAERLSTLRAGAASRFAAAVADELAALAMGTARLEVTVRQREDPGGLTVGRRRLAFGWHGTDEVQLYLAAHPGAVPRPLQRGASGGELSRIMLALEVVFAGADPVPTFVFDEVDAGVGGRAAVEIGRRLARLARTAQVVVVTHLPQVAAFADRHLVVTKTDDGRVTRSGVRRLDDKGRVRELSRMLAGLEGSATAAAHAEELLVTARTAVA